MSDPLRNAGLRRTPARRAAWEQLQVAARPMSHGELREVLSTIDEVTLYRSLSALESAGLVHQVHGIDGVRRFSANPPDAEGCPGNHVHFSCRSCGAMACLADQEMPRVVVPEGATVEGRHFLVYGRCATCSS